MRYAGWVSQVEASGTTNAITATPTIFINGKQVKGADYTALLTDPKALAGAGGRSGR